MPGQPAKAKEEAGQNRARPGALPSHGTKQIEEDEGRPDSGVKLLGPSICGDNSPQRVHTSGENGGRAATPQIAGQGVGGERRQIVNQYVIPMQCGHSNPTVFQRHQEQKPVQWICRAGLALTKERDPTPAVGVPQREPPMVPLAGLELERG